MDSAFLLILTALISTISLFFLLIGFTIYYDGKKKKRSKKQKAGIVVIAISLLPVAIMGLILVIWALILYLER